MNTTKQKLKTIAIAKVIMICLGLVLGLSSFYTGTNTAHAASTKSKTACNKFVTTQELRQACYYGYDKIGDSQNRGKKCRGKFTQSNEKQSACITGAALARQASNQPPTIKRCERDDIDNKKQCKKDYRKCDSVKGKKAKAECKKDKVGKHIKPKKKEEKREEPAGIGDAGKFTCGTFENQERNVKTRFNFGCLGTDFAKNGQGRAGISPILDLTFAFVRFMSIGVGIVLVASIIMSAIQYSMSEGNAEVTQKAKSRIRSASMGFIIYIFAYAILQFVIPGGIFQ